VPENAPPAPAIDHQRRRELRALLSKAGDRLGIRPDGPVAYGWRDRSAGRRVRSCGGPRWLRLVAEPPTWVEDAWWRGNEDANALAGIPRPCVLDVIEWAETGSLRVRAELMTLASGHVCSATPELRRAIELPARWWTDLRGAMDSLQTTPTNRVNMSDALVSERLATAGAGSPDRIAWTTAHGDLHWANLTAPSLTILDWEGWGRAPVGTDAATLHAYSLLVPEIAAQVHDTFADILDSPDGLRARLLATVRLQRRIEHGDPPILAKPLQRQVRELASRLR
jgi:hypothetical protein